MEYLLYLIVVVVVLDGLFNKYRLSKNEWELIKSLRNLELLEPETWKE